MDVEPNEPEYLNVRETARRLGVHENTVRNWARDGILPTARVPGSRFHRFDARDVERLHQQRGATVTSVEQERRTIGPELVDATQLSHWATTRDAQDKFPELVRRLLASTPGVTNVSVRAGEGVSAPGWDARAESVGTAHLPRGSLYFELGVGGRPKAKADEEYEKRRQALAASAPDSSFIFVTPRRWAGAAAWADERRAEGAFSDVRVLDADDLEGWLQQAPAVHQWISEHLRRRPRDAETLERWWARFQARTDPPLPAELFLAGRDREREQLKEFFGGGPGVAVVQADWRDEAVAFVCATIEALGREASNPVPLIVSSAEVWDRVALQPGRMLLLPLFENADVATAQKHGHHVVFPVGRDQVASGTKIELNRPDRQRARELLEAAGIETDRAHDLAGLARRSMPSLVRKLARDPRFARPPWSQPPEAAIFAPLVLLGAWTAGAEDTGIIERMVNETWPRVERALVHWRSTDDPPFVRSGNEWHVASAEEAFQMLRGELTPSDLERWHEIAVEVLLETDPGLELSIEERPMAGVMGVARTYSSVLRRGLAEGLALASSIDDERLSDGVSGADHARRIVREILERANVDTSGRIWRSLADELPRLAEAAPHDFLDAIHDDLDRNEPLLATMFQDSEESSWLYSSSPHTGLLWALETLCWSPEYLLDASRALARLDVVDPGGRLSNRPLESLTTVLVAWIRHTAAPLDLRVRAVENICRHFPDVGWRLVLALWPSHHATSSIPSGPRFHAWKPDGRSVSIREWAEFVGSLVRLAIALAADGAARWAELIGRLGPLPPPDRDQLLDALDRVVDAGSLATDDRVLLWESLHTEILRHRRFSSADWSMDAAPLSRMQTIADRLEPTANVERFGYLFDWRPHLPDVDLYDHAAYDGKLLGLRTRAVSETLASASTEGLRRLAERSPVPTQLGWVVGAVAPDELTPELLTWLDSDNAKLRDLASSWASRKLQDGGARWMREALARPEMTTEARRRTLVLNAPATREVWDALAEIDPELSDAYWSGMRAWPVSPQDATRASQELLAHERPWAAVDLLGLEAHRKDESTSMTPALVEEVLNAALAADPSNDRGPSLGYELGLLLDYLEENGSAPELLARYEFLFFRLLEDAREPRALFQAMRADPSLFVELVSRVYRGKDEPRREPSEHDEALAHHAWWVLREWRDLPGRRQDGTIDGDHLQHWVRAARLAFAESDREDIGDEQIGQVLAASPPGTDEIWPSEPVRDIIETIGSTSIDTGIHVGVANDRGVTSRGVYDGGQQERELAGRYRIWAKATADNWPRTSRVLRGLAESFERDAQREDERAQVRADTQ